MRVQESDIENQLVAIEKNPEIIFDTFQELQERNIGFFQHLVSEESILTKEEQDYFACILFIIIQSSKFEIENLEGSEWSEIEEEYWTLFGNQENMSSFFDICFEQMVEEELLAYLEDCLSEMEDDFLSKVGREYILIKSTCLIRIINDYLPS